MYYLSTLSLFLCYHISSVIDPLKQSRVDPEYLKRQIPPEMLCKLSVTDIYLQLLKNESKNESKKSTASSEIPTARSALVSIDELRNTDSDSPEYLEDSDDSTYH